MLGARIVVVEDEEDIRELIEYHLEREGFEIFGAGDGKRGLELVQREVPDLVLLDLMLPGMDGLEVCRAIRADERVAHVPVLMVTAKAEEADVVLGLGLGADDYIPKPFRPRELIARVKAALRGKRRLMEIEADAEPLVRGKLRMDPARHRVFLGDEELSLTATEFKLLWTLARRPGRVFGREDLLEASRGDAAMALDRSVDAHIRSVRKKLGESRDLIETVRSMGYRFTELSG
jgi:two-component system phosphate regulon response regulator PhoB